MANAGVIIIGISLLVIAVIGYFTPYTSTYFTIPQVHEICQTDMVQLAQSMELMIGSQELTKICMDFRNLAFAIYGLGAVGIILIIVGAVIQRGKESSTVCSYCNFVGKTEAELLDHKAKNHLDKSPYKCGHCDFIGITEEILWNHYNDKHPDEKKW